MKQLRVSSSFNLHCYPKDNFAEYIRAGLRFFKENGFDAVDFSTSLLDLTSDGWRPQVEEALAAADEIGLKFEIGHLPFISTGSANNPKYLAEFDERMHRAIDAAAALGLGYAVLHPNSLSTPVKKYSRAEQFDLVMRHLTPFVEHAKRVGLNVVVENMRWVPGMSMTHRYCQSHEELCEVADALDIGICWDFGHANVSGSKQSEALAYIGKRLKVLHVNDNDAIDDIHLLPFTGNVDWKDAMHGLAMTGFDGLFNFELSTARLPASMRTVFAAAVIEAAKELMSYIK